MKTVQTFSRSEKKTLHTIRKFIQFERKRHRQIKIKQNHKLQLNAIATPFSVQTDQIMKWQMFYLNILSERQNTTSVEHRTQKKCLFRKRPLKIQFLSVHKKDDRTSILNIITEWHFVRVQLIEISLFNGMDVLIFVLLKLFYDWKFWKTSMKMIW